MHHQEAGRCFKSTIAFTLQEQFKAMPAPAWAQDRAIQRTLCQKQEQKQKQRQLNYLLSSFTIVVKGETWNVLEIKRQKKINVHVGNGGVLLFSSLWMKIGAKEEVKMSCRVPK